VTGVAGVAIAVQGLRKHYGKPKSQC